MVFHIIPRIIDTSTTYFFAFGLIGKETNSAPKIATMQLNKFWYIVRIVSANQGLGKRSRKSKSGGFLPKASTRVFYAGRFIQLNHHANAQGWNARVNREHGNNMPFNVAFIKYDLESSGC